MATGAPPVSAARTARGFRLDLQGIRGFALILVLGCHAEVPGFAGGFVGLDVFYVLSGFLITGLILGEIDRHGRLSLRDFYARRARRLLPLAVTVLVVTLVLGALTFPETRLHQLSDDVIAAAVYVANWAFMAQQVDYFSFEDQAVSAVQHFWSLSVEEQFYLAWPPLIVALAALARRQRLRPRGVCALLLGALAFASFVYGIGLTGEDPARAYFSTPARGWELAVGGVLACVLPAGLRLTRNAAVLLVGGGLVVLLAVTLAFTASTTYPGWHAALPVLATVAIITGGTAVRLPAPALLLTSAPLQYLGRISYAYYLWHWPALVFAWAWWGTLDWTENLAVTLVAWVPTIVSHHLIEERFRRSPDLARRPRRSIAVGAACTATAVAVALVAVALRPGIPVAPADEVTGARAARAPVQEVVKAIRPSPADARDDRGQVFGDGCLVDGFTRESPSCVYGAPESRRTVVVLGDSHALQYTPALVPLAERRGWRLVVLTRASCIVGDVDYQPTCNAWREHALERIEELSPALVVTSNATDKRFRVKVGGRRLSRAASQPVLERGFARTYRRLAATGARVVVLRDQSRVPFDAAECVGEHPDRLRLCVFRPHRPARFAFDRRAAERAGVKVIDPIDVLCPGAGDARRCRAVIGDVLVYRDTYHLSATFARTLQAWLAPRLPAV